MTDQPTIIATEERRAKKLRQVRKLLVTADDIRTPENERDAARARADALMAKFAIEEWQVQGHDDDSRRPEPQARPFDFDWFVEMPKDHASPMYGMFMSTARHCRCEPVYWEGLSSNFDRVTSTYHRELIVVGLPADLDYLDLIFTNLLLEVGNGLEPKPDPERPMIENLARMKEAGMKWQRIADLLADAGQLPQHTVGGPVHNLDLAGKYTRYCKENNRDRLKIAPQVYQRSFMEGFESVIAKRFRDMRKLQEQGTFMDEIKSNVEGPGNALVLQDIAAMVSRKANEMFPKPEPKGGKVRRYKADTRKRSGMAEARGAEAGATARLTPEAAGQVGTTKKEIARG